MRDGKLRACQSSRGHVEWMENVAISELRCFLRVIVTTNYFTKILLWKWNWPTFNVSWWLLLVQGNLNEMRVAGIVNFLSLAVAQWTMATNLVVSFSHYYQPHILFDCLFCAKKHREWLTIIISLAWITISITRQHLEVKAFSNILHDASCCFIQKLGHYPHFLANLQSSDSTLSHSR